MKIPFDIKYRPQIESGKYKVMLDCGVEAEILAWDKPGKYPIVCMAKKEGAIPFRTDNNGIAYHYPESSNYSDLFIVTQEPEFTEFEKKLWEVLKSEGSPIYPIEKFTNSDKDVFHSYAAKLLTLAREQFIKDGYVIEKKAFHDAAEKVDTEVMKEISAKVDMEEAIRIGYEKGRADALKDLPRWEKDDSIKAEQYITVGKNGERFHYKGHSLLISNLTKLPGFKED